MRELHMHRLPRLGVYPLPNDIGELDIFHTTRGEDASGKHNGNDIPPSLLQVDIIYAATVHGLCPRELYD
jgi:hypothetical protein